MPISHANCRGGLASLLLLAVSAASICATAANGTGNGSQLDCSGYENPDAVANTDFLGPVLYVTAGNNRFAYRRFQLGGPPDATPLVVIMGYGGTMSFWGPTLLARLAQHREVVIFDGMAQGLSEEVEPTTGPLTPEALEEGTLGFLSALDLGKPPHLAGLSLGACVALKLAAFHPDRISKVVSWGGTSPDGHAVVGSFSTMNSLFRPNNTDDDLVPLFYPLHTEEGRRGACFWLSDKRRMPLDEANPEINVRYVQGIKTAVLPWKWASWRALKNCQVAVLLMGGTEDIIIPKHAQTNLAARIPGAWLAQFPGAGHGFLWQHMDQALAVVEAFLQEGLPAGSGSKAAGAGSRAADEGLAEL